LLKRTVLGVYGSDHVEEAVTVEVGENMQPISGSEMRHKVDVVALAVGLMPMADLFQMLQVETVYIPELGGFVPWHDELGHTTNPSIYVAGDAGGIEEATTASLAGSIAGLVAAKELGFTVNENWIDEYLQALSSFRESSLSRKVLEGIERMRGDGNA